MQVIALEGSGGWQVDDGVASRRYGSLEPARRARYAFRTAGRTSATFAILRGSPPAWRVAHERLPVGERVHLTGADFDDLVMFDPAGAIDGIRTDARVAWVRRRASDGTVLSVLAIGGTAVELDGTPVARQAGGVVSAVRGPWGWRVATSGAPGSPGRQS